ncbi:hypothetical protein DL96DRAFT_1715409 [Flagelloscypha sp. PMI_526]|nr:hypothetical protein DL96DRAFT_1715409 [Flagelloscypha sp. PMI_526]
MSTTPVLPRELIWRIIALVPDDHSLHACSLVSTNFVDPAQQVLFKSVYLGYSQSARLLPILQSSPHIAAYITSLSLFKCTSDIIELLPLLSQVRHLELVNYYFEDWTHPMLDVFQRVLLPHITHIDLDQVSIPISIIATCTRLLHLSILASDIGKDDDFALGGQTVPLSSPSPLQVLSLDSIRNSSGQRSLLFTEMIASGHFPSVRCLRIPLSDFELGRNDQDVTVDELPDLLDPFRDNLACLDIHYWPIPGEYSRFSLLVSFDDANRRAERETTTSMFWSPQNPFFIGNFLNLRFLQVTMGERTFDQSYGKETVWRLSWLAGMIKDLAKPHPLSTVLFENACEFFPESEEKQGGIEGLLRAVPVQKAWKELDQALNSHFDSDMRELKLPQLKTVAISLVGSDTEDCIDEAASFFSSCLPRCLASKKLVFKDIDIEEFYWSLPVL